MAVTASHQDLPVVLPFDGSCRWLYLSQMAPASEKSSASVLSCPDRPPFSPSSWSIGHSSLPLPYHPPLNNASRRGLFLYFSHSSLYLNRPFCPPFILFSFILPFLSPHPPYPPPKASTRHSIFTISHLPRISSLKSRDFLVLPSSASLDSPPHVITLPPSWRYKYFRPRSHSPLFISHKSPELPLYLHHLLSSRFPLFSLLRIPSDLYRARTECVYS